MAASMFEILQFLFGISLDVLTKSVFLQVTLNFELSNRML